VNKAFVFDIRRFSVHDGPGIRTTVFFKGCPLSCWWCHNPESRDIHAEHSTKHLMLDGMKFEREETTGKWMSVEEVMHEVIKDSVFYDESGGGVTFSGGEPILQETVLLELLRACRQQGIHTSLDTSGYTSRQSMELISGLVDLFLYDLKIINEEMHMRYTGVSNQSILENLIFLFHSGKNVILRFPVVPGITDTTENIRDIKQFITNNLTIKYLKKNINTSAHQHIITSAHQLSLLPYHSMAREKYRRFCKSNFLERLPDLKQADLIPLKAEFESIGLQVNIGG
jgi:pyruvate formate lyase activating enzyme